MDVLIFLALNYNPKANIDDGLCDYIYGCIDTEADNYNSEANIDDGRVIIFGCTDSQVGYYGEKCSYR